jgi:hypothetical protein
MERAAMAVDNSTDEWTIGDAIRYLVDDGVPADVASSKITKLLPVTLHCKVNGAPQKIEFPPMDFWDPDCVTVQQATDVRYTVSVEAVKQLLRPSAAERERVGVKFPAATNITHQWIVPYQAPVVVLHTPAADTAPAKAPANTKAATKPGRAWQGDRVRPALRKLYPDGVRAEIPTQAIWRKVVEELAPESKNLGLGDPSLDTVARVLGRK